MNVDYERWAYAIGVLSLDSVRPFLQDLWFPIPTDDELTRNLRSTVMDLASEPAGDNTVVAIERFRGFLSRRYMIEEQQSIDTWISDILVKAGSDRASEAIWRHICYGVANRRAPAPSQISGMLNDIFQRDRELSRQFNSRLKQSLSDSVSDWEQSWRSANPWRRVPDILGTTVSANVFALCWATVAGSLGAGTIEEVTQFARVNAVALDLKGVTTDAPGRWSLRYAKLLDEAVKRLNQSEHADGRPGRTYTHEAEKGES